MKMTLASRGRGDAFLLRWGVLAVASLALTVLAQACGLFAAAGESLNAALAGSPFYFSLRPEAMLSVLGRGSLFAVSAVIVLYGSAALLRAESWGRVVVLWAALAVAAALPEFVAALWNGYLNMAAPVFGLTMATVLRLAVPFFRSAHESS